MEANSVLPAPVWEVVGSVLQKDPLILAADIFCVIIQNIARKQQNFFCLFPESHIDTLHAFKFTFYFNTVL